LLPASWEKVNLVYKVIDNAFNDALIKYKPTTYEVFLVLACLKYKLYTVETTGFFLDEIEKARHAASEEGLLKIDKDPPDVYK